MQDLACSGAARARAGFGVQPWRPGPERQCSEPGGYGRRIDRAGPAVRLWLHFRAGRQSAQGLEIYHKALAAEPDRPQRLHILFRLAQLQSCAYHMERGEAPNYPQALRLYQQIVASYSPEEPLVLQATTGVADCLVSLRRFDEALYWSRKAL